VAFLPAEAFDLCHGNALNPHIGKGRTHIIQLERLDDGNDHFHAGKLLIQVRIAGKSAVGVEIC
jgi:hypothetical protein